VRVDRLERRDAWAEAVRLALRAAIERRTFLTAPTDGTMRGSPDDPTVFDEERMRLTAMMSHPCDDSANGLPSLSPDFRGPLSRHL
jgi:hypothetical protein